MTDGQYLIITTISAIVLLVVLQFLKRRLYRNEKPGEPYEDMAEIPSLPANQKLASDQLSLKQWRHNSSVLP